MYRWVLMIWALSIFPFINVKAQNTSNKGKEFWIAYTGHIDGKNSKMYLYVTSDVNTTVDVKIGGLSIAGSPFAITANNVQAISIDPEMAYVGTSDIIESGKAIEVIAAQPVVVYSHIFKAARSGASLILPAKALGREYYATAYTQNKSGTSATYSEFTIVAVEDNTLIEITPKAKDIGSNHLGGVTFQRTLQKGEIYQYQSETDLSGSHIISLAGANGICKPIAVFSGSSWVGFCGNNIASGSGGDNLYQQLYPITAWGKEFITAPFIRKPHDIFRVYFSKDNTQLTINGVISPTTFNKGTFYEFTSAEANSIKANEPISVVQYQISQSCDPANKGFSSNEAPHPGDPEMTVLNPVEQTLSKITVYSAQRNQTNPATNITQHYINIIIKDEFIASFTINGQVPEGTFVSIVGTGYSYLQEDVTARSFGNATHTLMADGGFSAIAYGYGGVESYGYLAGADAKNLYENLQIFNADTHLLRSDVCVGETAGFTLVLPFEPLQLTWTVDGVEETAIDHPAHNGTEVINGVTIYKYNYSRNIAFDQPGVHQIKATVINPSPSGCDPKQEIVTDFEAFALPESKFLPSTVETCAGTAIKFTDISIENGKAISKWHWNFGDGTGIHLRRSAEPFDYIYVNPGPYTVTLMVETESGCLSPESIPFDIHVNKLPEAKFKYTIPTCETHLITFTDESIGNEGEIIKWHWDFGDVNAGSGNPNVSTLQHPTHIFSIPGTYKVVLTVETDKGCSNILEQDIIINKLPVSDFETPDACSSDAAVKFINTSVNTIAGLQYVWDFGDRGSGALNKSTDEHGTHQYTAAGLYTVTLLVITPDGCTTFKTKTFRVNGNTPTAAFQVLNTGNLCSNMEILVRDDSSIGGFDRITRIEWYIDGSLVLEQKDPIPNSTYALNVPAFSFPLTRPVPLKLIAFSGAVDGPCQNVSEVNITLHAVPLIQFDALAPVCLNAGESQIDASEIGNVDGQGEFSGPGISSTGLFDPKRAGVGTWDLTYAYTGDNGCVAITKTQSIVVKPIPKVDVVTDLYAFVDGTVQVKASTTEPGLRYKWSPSKGLSRDDILNPIITAEEDRVYTLTVTSSLDCGVPIFVRLHVLKDVVAPNAFSPNGDNVNDVWKLNYLESYPNSTVEIFNRYGEKVFFSQGYSIPFDGNYKGNPLPVGTYYYLINPRNGKKSISGSLTLIR